MTRSTFCFSRLSVAVAAVSITLLYAQPVQTPLLPDGEGKDLTETVCSACHELVLVTSERRTQPQWQDLVDDMMRRGAEATDAEKKVILAYLVKNFSKDSTGTPQRKPADTEPDTKKISQRHRLQVSARHLNQSSDLRTANRPK